MVVKYYAYICSIKQRKAPQSNKLLEIHKNGINAHNNEVSFYGIDFQTKTLMFDGIENVECAIEIAKELGYKISEIQMVF